MRPAQIDLLQRLIEQDRRVRTRRAAGEVVDWDFRGVEVGKINGVDMRTALSLADAGLIEMVDMGHGITYAFLGKYNPFDN